jgi:hypothetical protein
MSNNNNNNNNRVSGAGGGGFLNPNNEYDDNEYSSDTGQDTNTQFNRDIF